MESQIEGFPIIILKEEEFEIKAIDFWEFRTFKYSEVTKIEYSKRLDSQLIFVFFVYLYELEHAPFKLKIYKKNGADWTYDCSKNEDPEFNKILREIEVRCGIEVRK